MNTFYIEKGRVTDPSAYESSDVKEGDIEWQFSDAPSGARSISYDFIGRLNDAIASMRRDFGECNFIRLPLEG